MKHFPSWILAVAAGFLAATVALRTFVRTPGNPPLRNEGQTAEKSVHSESSLNGAKVVTVSGAAQARAGIRVAPLVARSAQKRITAPAVVLSAQSLVAARAGYLAARAKLEKARVNLDVARKEYARLKTLYQDDQNISQKTFQSAQATLDSDNIDLRSAREQLALQAWVVRQKWGGMVTKWVKDPSPTLDQVLGQKMLLVEVSLPDGEIVPPPSTVGLALPGGRQRRATFVSPLSQVDPRVQGVSLLYLAPATAGLAPSVTLAARLRVGRRMRGVVVPASAVVWSDGRTWVYVQIAPTNFVRRALGSGFRLDGGYFAPQGFSPGERVVISGAQILLSDELSPPASSASEGEEDEDD